MIALAASSKAAEVLATELGIRTENVHKWLHEAARVDTRCAAGAAGVGDPWFRPQAGDMVLVDEAGMVGTRQLADIVSRAHTAGAVVRLLEHEAAAVHLDSLHRFADPDEAAATLRLRDGDVRGLGFYQRRGRVRDGSREAMTEAAYTGWAADLAAGRQSILIAASTDDVAALNTRAPASTA